jgi:hypothetical protein
LLLLSAGRLAHDFNLGRETAIRSNAGAFSSSAMRMSRRPVTRRAQLPGGSDFEADLLRKLKINSCEWRIRRISLSET